MPRVRQGLAQFDPLLDPVTPEQVKAWRAAQARPYTPGNWWAQFRQGLASLIPSADKSPEQNLYRMNQMGAVGTSQGMAASALTRPMLGTAGMNVFHGSPHRFDKFDMSKVGTGEGAQAYGHGLYLAENPKTAAAYSDTAKNSFAGGYTYKVDLPDDQIAKMLDWDKPLSQQPESVRKVIGQIVDRNIDKEIGWSKLTGEQAYQAVVERAGKKGDGEKMLRDLGIPGIRYLDQGSRAGGKGTSNFVVFDDSIPKIVGRE